MNAPTPIGTDANRLPPAAVALIASRLLNKHSPQEIGDAIEILIDVLDLIGGDPDLEDATDAEDDFNLTADALANAEPGPGCDISDAGGQRDEDGINSGYALVLDSGPGCPISDPAGHDLGDQ